MIVSVRGPRGRVSELGTVTTVRPGFSARPISMLLAGTGQAMLWLCFGRQKCGTEAGGAKQWVGEAGVCNRSQAPSPGSAQPRRTAPPSPAKQSSESRSALLAARSTDQTSCCHFFLDFQGRDPAQGHQPVRGRPDRIHLPRLRGGWRGGPPPQHQPPNWNEGAALRRVELVRVHPSCQPRDSLGLPPHARLDWKPVAFVHYQGGQGGGGSGVQLEEGTLHYFS